jgi:dienelactone hydrolase
MTRIAAFAALVLLTAQQAAGQHAPLAIGDDTVSIVRGTQAGTLVLPEGKPPFPAVILLHGCGGVTQNMNVWAQRLRKWGYAALILDSFAQRGIDNVCNKGQAFPGRERAQDAFAASAYLRMRSDIDTAHIGLIGFSHGGSTALAASVQNRVKAFGGQPFAAVAAYYPACPAVAPQLANDVQILIGAADDWTAATRCSDWAALYANAGAHKPLLKIYPDAVHAFDAKAPSRLYFGHRLGYDPKAAEDSFKLTRQFLDSRLRPEAPHE